MFVDQMTPKEREAALAKGEAVDRFPIGLIYDVEAHKLGGHTRPWERESGKNMAQVQIECYNTFHHDSLGTTHGLHGIGMLYGSQYDEPEHGAPSITHYILDKVEDVDELDLALACIEKDVISQNCLECLEILQEKLGDEVGCGMCFAGPFTAAGSLLAPEKLFKAMIKNPEQTHKLLDFSTNAIIALAEPFWKMGFGTCLADPTASGTLLSGKRFKEFVQPYAARVVEASKKYGENMVSVHICGDTSNILLDVADCGYSSFSVDNLVSLKLAKEVLGNVMAISGNLHPVDEMMLGTPRQVRQAVRRCFAEAWDAPKGFVISTGCDCVSGTPLENIFAYLDEAKQCAAWQYAKEGWHFDEEVK